MPLSFWIAFNAAVLLLLALDLFVLHSNSRRASMWEAAATTSVWIGLSLAFNLFIWRHSGPERALEFLTGYVVEYSMSVDNIFLFVLIFAYFQIPGEHQHRILT